MPFNIPFVTMTPQGQPVDIDPKLSREQLESITNDGLQGNALKTVHRWDQGSLVQAVDVVACIV